LPPSSAASSSSLPVSGSNTVTHPSVRYLYLFMLCCRATSVDARPARRTSNASNGPTSRLRVPTHCRRGLRHGAGPPASNVLACVCSGI
jgi:hypothetical protein